MYVHVTQNLRLNINVLAAIFGDEFYDLRSNLCSISRLMLPFCANLTKLCGSSHHGLLHDNFAMANATILEQHGATPAQIKTDSYSIYSRPAQS